MSLIAGLDGLSGEEQRALMAAIQQDVDMQGFQARLEARTAAAELGEGRRSMEGLGRVRMEVPLTSYHYWGNRLGYECWKDRQFLHEYERDNPEVRVKCAGTRVQVGYSGRERQVKWRKAY